MRRLFFAAAILLVWAGTLTAAELKVKIPVDEYKQIQSRIETLEKENSQLKQTARSLEREKNVSRPDPQTQARLEALERENNQLKQAAKSVPVAKSAGPDPALQARLESLERENNQLKQAAKSAPVAKSGAGPDPALQARLETLEKENAQLKKEVNFNTGVNQKISQSDQDTKAAIATLEIDNAHLKRDLKTLQDEGTLASRDRRTARQVYAEVRKNEMSHVYK